MNSKQQQSPKQKWGRFMDERSHIQAYDFFIKLVWAFIIIFSLGLMMMAFFLT